MRWSSKLKSSLKYYLGHWPTAQIKYGVFIGEILGALIYNCIKVYENCKILNGCANIPTSTWLNAKVVENGGSSYIKIPPFHKK